jgi:hypothetical protein
MRKFAELEKRVYGLEHRKPFRLSIFVRITLEPGHDYFDRAEAGVHSFARQDGETEQAFRDRVNNATDASVILMYPHKYDEKRQAHRNRCATQLETHALTTKKFEPGAEGLPLHTTPTSTNKDP